MTDLNKEIADGFNGLSANGIVAGNPVFIVSGDIVAYSAQKGAGAIVVPQFPDRASTEGFGAAIRKAGGGAGMDAFDDFVRRSGGKLPRGAAHVTPSGLPHTPFFIHVVAIDDSITRRRPLADFDFEQQYSMISTGFHNALKAAEAAGISEISAPALGTGNGMLTRNSATAMMEALRKHAAEGGVPVKTNFVVFSQFNSDEKTHEKSFREVLADEKLQARAAASHYHGFYLRMTQGPI